MPGSQLVVSPDPGVAVTWSEDIGARIVALYAQGVPYHVIASHDGMPAVQTMFEWKERHPEWANALARARLAKADRLAEDGLSLVDGCDGDSASQVGKAREQGGYRRWLAGCLDRDTYGDRTNVNVTGALAVLTAFVDSTPRRVVVAAADEALPHVTAPDHEPA